MKPTKQQKLSDLNEAVKERKAYLETIERSIEDVTTAGNNQLLNIQAEIDGLERERARLLKLNYGLEQKIRENKRLAEM